MDCLGKCNLLNNTCQLCKTIQTNIYKRCNKKEKTNNYTDDNKKDLIFLEKYITK